MQSFLGPFHALGRGGTRLGQYERLRGVKMRLYDTAHLLVLDSVRRDVPFQEVLKPLADRLVTDGLLERVSRGRGARLILSRTFSQAIGESAAYTRRKGLDQEECKLLLLKHLHLKGKEGAPLAELAQVLPSKSKRQVQHFLRLLAEEGKATAPRPGPGAAWKSTFYESIASPKELNTKPDHV